MSEDIQHPDVPGGLLEDAAETPPEDQAADEALLENLLVEEVSIDGMCGVY